MTQRQVKVKNILVHYKVFGQGQAMLILHGWPSSSGQWSKVAEYLAKQNIMAIIPDLPGFGFTPAPQMAWNLDNYVELIHEFSNNVEELKQDFYLVGHSFGGALAVKFGIKYNQHVQKLFLISSACVRKKTIIRKLWYRLAKMIKLFSFLPGYDLFRKAVYRFVLRKSDYLYVSGIMKETYLRVISEDLSYKVNFLKIPTIIIWGDKDQSTPVSQAQFIHQQIPGSTLTIIAGADHSPHIKVPEILTEKILQNI